MNDRNNHNKGIFGRAGGDKSTASGPIVPVSPSQALKPEMAPPPPKRSRRARNQVVMFLNFILSLMIFIAVVAVGAFLYGKSEFEGRGPLDRTTDFMVREGAALNQIASGLEGQGIISNQRIFSLGAKSVLGDDTLKAGEYEIKAHSSMREIVELMQSGKSILHAFTVPEGQTVEQVFDRLRADTMLVGDLPAEMPAEGALLPETYKFSRGTTRTEILEQMEKAQARVLEQVWARRVPDLPIKTPEELVILASIVEKETAKADERPRVAGVFINRLNQSIRLQSDPTIIYGLFGGAGKPSDRPIYKSDIEKPTPYNTYVIDGLPPTPIANPGREAMEAVANPSKTKDLYFVADGTGGHAFAETLDEHNTNVARWRRLESEREKTLAAEKAEAAKVAADQAAEGAAEPEGN
ncbi:endolytic transglycosylase MltG [Hoeflea sp. YIM 152468]|uniref:endolytic transglycosylase MltG n=1 Tax=Hoeflea sp. YIM 152468 TaxID=3031759 RepID=UPI0023D99643|nr:endolytic transglycosylase MltG [Hoeflea sp. YIM 152468]MDF1607230.1 endolytic transglycosylase MltG [Hoeflea sp. YIM 152468]